MKKPEFVYPGSDLDRSRNLIAALGSFWSKIYTGVDQVHSYVTATAQVVNQTYQNLVETVEALSRFDVPLYHKELLTPIVLKKSERNSARTTAARFDRTTAVFNGELIFDVAPTAQFFSFPLPTALADVAQLFNRITFPTGVLVKNTDFVIDRDNNAIIFAQDPFENASFIKRPTPDDPGDEELTLWGFCGNFDYNTVFNQFAYAVGIKLRTSQGYKDLTNAVISGLVSGGATAAILDSALAAICGIPVSIGPQETVEFIDNDAAGLLIITDKAVYRFTENAVPRVEVEQVIPAGTQLVYGIDVHEFFVGNTYARQDAAQGVICCPPPNNLLSSNDWELLTTETEDELLIDPNNEQCQPVRKTIAALALDKGFLSSCFYGDLVFENRAVPLEVNTAHHSGYTYVKFRLGGYPADVERFFDEIHDRGKAAAEFRASQPDCAPKQKIGTLAHLLDKRVNPASEPLASHLPKTINPLRFLVENVLRNNVFVVRISISALGLNHLGLYNIRHLRQLLPPQTAMIVIFELTADKDKITPENAIFEAVANFTGMEPQKDEVPVSLVSDLGATARLVSGTCQ
ncbi:hypothetical protein EBZ80_21190 [bacterium]|nr:hypothetical protein [Betaproteobacteria bacterium]NDE17446.1 hypothetical protein [bacterium]